MSCSSTTVEDEPEGAVRILFIGNSLTQANDLPEMVAAMAEAGVSRPVVVHKIIFANTSLEDHWFLGHAREAIQDEGPWDFVVMQQGPSSLPENQQNLAQWAQTFATEIRAAGATPALYMVWPGEARHFAFGDVVASYTNAAKAADARLLPAGSAFLAAWDRNPDLALYSGDGFHPSALGSYLAALVIYAGLLDASPSDAPTTISLPKGQVTVPSSVARVFKQAAAEVLAASKAEPMH